VCADPAVLSAARGLVATIYTYIYIYIYIYIGDERGCSAFSGARTRRTLLSVWLRYRPHSPGAASRAFSAALLPSSAASSSSSLPSEYACASVATAISAVVGVSWRRCKEMVSLRAAVS